MAPPKKGKQPNRGNGSSRTEEPKPKDQDRTPALRPALAQVTTDPKTMSAQYEQPLLIPYAGNEDLSPNSSIAQQSEEDMEMENVLLGVPSSEGDQKKTLLSLRQTYKKTRCNLARTRSHLKFIKDCNRQGKIPKGLKVTNKCHAILKNETDVEIQFITAATQAECCFSQALLSHYVQIERKLDRDLRSTEQTMTSVIQTPGDPEALEEHAEMLAKTIINIEKYEQELDRKKTAKSEKLAQPTTRQKGNNPKKVPQNRAKGKGEFKRNNVFNSPTAHPPGPSKVTKTRPNPPPQATPEETQTPPPNMLSPAQMEQVKSIFSGLLYGQAAPPGIAGPSRPPPPQPPQAYDYCTGNQQPPPLFGYPGRPSTQQLPPLAGLGRQYHFQ